MPFDRAPAEWLDDAIPVFAPRTEEDRARDRYDRSFDVPDVYTGIAFGHRLFGDGAAEGLYRTMSALLLAGRPQAVLDVGCGVGRVLYDCAAALPETQFTGLDYSYNMCRRARALLQGREPIALPGLERWGWAGVQFAEARELANVELAQGSALDLPFAPATFDTVMATLLLCRLSDPVAALAQMVRVLRPQGRLFLATPCGFTRAEDWENFVPPDKLRSHLAMLGLRVEEWFENLIYREHIDAHGNAQEWRVRVIAVRAII